MTKPPTLKRIASHGPVSAVSFSQKARLRALRALRALAGGHVLWERNGGWLQKRKNDTLW